MNRNSVFAEDLEDLEGFEVQLHLGVGKSAEDILKILRE